MIWRHLHKKQAREMARVYHVTFQMLTGAGSLQAHSTEDLNRLLGELRLAGASNITVVDCEGRLFLFDPGGPAS